MTSKTSLLVLGTLSVTSVAMGQTLAASDREAGMRTLAASRTALVEAVQGLSEEQWKFKPAADRWSIAQVVEHLAKAEDMLHRVIGGLSKGDVAAPDRDYQKADAMIMARVPDRTEKAQSPPIMTPNGQWTPAEALKHFLAGRAETASLLQSTPDLRGHTINHPLFGPMDGYEWILAVALHSERHTKQILEVKADPRFPANPSATR